MESEKLLTEEQPEYHGSFHVEATDSGVERWVTIGLKCSAFVALCLSYLFVWNFAKMKKRQSASSEYG